MEDKKAAYFVIVEVSDGMFSKEYAIKLRLSDGKDVSFFADKELIKFEGGKYKLSATLVKRDVDHNIDTVLLPSETFETSSRWVTVASQI